MSITVLHKGLPSVQCNATYRALDAKGIEYEILDLSEDPTALEQVKALGYMQAPVVVTGRGSLVGLPSRQDRRARLLSGVTPHERRRDRSAAPDLLLERLG